VSLDAISRALTQGVRRLGCIAVCQPCVRLDDRVRDVDIFGDFGLCGRCHRPVTGRNRAFYVEAPPQEASAR